jgi:hypothetical protein
MKTKALLVLLFLGLTGSFCLAGTEKGLSTFYGEKAGANNLMPSNANSFFGYSAGYNDTNGWANTFMGGYAGYANVSGSKSTFIGFRAGYSNTTGMNNTFVGGEAGWSNTTAGFNTFIGSFAGAMNTAEYNTFVGDESGYSNTTGLHNTFLGYYSGHANITGGHNTFLGNGGGEANISGSQNIFVGGGAGQSNTTGNGNTFIGYAAGHSNQTGSGNIFLGNYAGFNETGSNRLYIDNSNTTSPLIYGDFAANRVGINHSSPGHVLCVGASGAYCDGGAWVDGSSREMKENIVPLTPAEALQAFARLEPVKYNYKENKDETYLGFIAEDVPELVATKERKGLSPMDLAALLTKVVQEQQKEISGLKEKIATLEKLSRKDK